MAEPGKVIIPIEAQLDLGVAREALPVVAETIRLLERQAELAGRALDVVAALVPPPRVEYLRADEGSWCTSCSGPYDGWLAQYGGHWDTCPNRHAASAGKEGGAVD